MAGNCAGCHQLIPDRRFLTCHICSQHYDLDCANVSEKRFYNTMSVDQKEKWKCPLCKSKAPKIDNKNTPIRQQQYNTDCPPTTATLEDQHCEESNQASDTNITFRKKSYFYNERNSYEDDDSICLPLGNTIQENPDSPSTKQETINLYQFNALLEQHFEQNNKYIISHLDSIKSEMENTLLELKIQFKQTTDNIKKQQFKIEKEIGTIDSKLQTLQQECSTLRSENELLRKELNVIKNTETIKEFKAKENNDKLIVLHGLTYNYWETNYDLTERISNIFYETMCINISGYIEEISFIGKKGSKRPVKIELISKRMKKYILENSDYFKGSGLGVSEYLDVAALREKRDLREAMLTARKKGLHAIIRDSKLIINGRETISTSLELEKINSSSKEVNKINTYIHIPEINRGNSQPPRQPDIDERIDKEMITEDPSSTYTNQTQRNTPISGNKNESFHK